MSIARKSATRRRTFGKTRTHAPNPLPQVGADHSMAAVMMEQSR